MRTHQRSITAVVLILTLATPAAAARRPATSRPIGIVETVKRLVFRAFSRVSPPVGSPDAPTDEPPTTTTDGPAKTQTL